MNLRKILIPALAFAALTSTTLLQAQEEKRKGGRGGMTPEAQIERIETAVGKLSDEQKSKVTATYAKAGEKMRAAGGPDGDREKMMEIMQQTRREVRAVLTPEQQKKFDEMPQRGGGNRKKEN